MGIKDAKSAARENANKQKADMLEATIDSASRLSHEELLVWLYAVNIMYDQCHAALDVHAIAKKMAMSVREVFNAVLSLSVKSLLVYRATGDTFVVMQVCPPMDHHLGLTNEATSKRR